jgi:hypothetical protein
VTGSPAPHAYVDLDGDRAWVPFYRAAVHGFFAAHTIVFVLAGALAQLAAAGAVWSRGRLGRAVRRRDELVVGLPPRAGRRRPQVTAYAALRPGHTATEAELIRHVRERVASCKYPGRSSSGHICR